MRFVVGVDGGGTKTTAVVVSEDVRVVGGATSGPANSRSVGAEAAAANIASAVSAALVIAGVRLDEVAALCLCLAGLDTDLDLPVPRAAVQALGYTGPAIFENDVVGAWAGATEVGAGLVVIAGTGSTALGMNARGEFWRTDGWDYVLGDSGSAYDIGRSAIRAAMRALDGRAAPTLLTREMGRHYSVADAEGMRRLVDSTEFGKVEMSGFAARVSEAANAGDVTARDILAGAGSDLAQQAIAIIRALGMAGTEFPVATVGSVFKATPWVTEPFTRLISQAAPRAVVRDPVHPPEVGAAILALHRLPEADFGSWSLGMGSRIIHRTLPIDLGASS
ncbi:MAG: hypothetical protein OJF49_004404 [Ktedonobacterales bacterium]|jgi:N-acetylglucosamine kinase-like BadF-type ATPase|nr:MAG: hypothetical protein OJF49_004404 [Ktedonobacterales bacterium]